MGKAESVPAQPVAGRAHTLNQGLATATAAMPCDLPPRRVRGNARASSRGNQEDQQQAIEHRASIKVRHLAAKIKACSNNSWPSSTTALTLARVRFSYAIEQDGSLSLQIAPQQGSFKPWWTQYRIEVHGLTPKLNVADLERRPIQMQRNATGWEVTVPSNNQGESIHLR